MLLPLAILPPFVVSTLNLMIASYYFLTPEIVT
jgi:hypothetical protein